MLETFDRVHIVIFNLKNKVYKHKAIFVVYINVCAKVVFLLYKSKEGEKNMMKYRNKNGITLVALVVTIVILLILAGVTIATLTWDNGLLIKAGQAKIINEEAELFEQIKLAYTEWQTEKLTGTTENANDFIKNRLYSSIGNVEEVFADDNAVTVAINKNSENITYYYNVKKGTVKQVELAKNSSNKNDSYVGCYADIDEDGIVDGIIFVDLLTGSVKQTQQWVNADGIYSIPTNVTIENVNNYYISQKSYTDSYFGTHQVISPLGNGIERFYVMELTNFTTPAYTDLEDDTKSYPEYKSYTWYKNAYGKMLATDTSTNFGTGKSNTKKMIEIWNSNGGNGRYTGATQDSRDVWKHIQTRYNQGWFLPSRAEWAAFSNELGITGNNYNSTYGISAQYLSSSQKNSQYIWYIVYPFNMISDDSVGATSGVRLATTF